MIGADSHVTSSSRASILRLAAAHQCHSHFSNTRKKNWILFHQQRVLNHWLIFCCVLTRTVIGWRGRLKECSHTRRRVNEICMVRCTAKSTQVVSPGGHKSIRCRFAGHLCAKHQHVQIGKFYISSSANVPFDSSWAVWHCWSSQEVGQFPKKIGANFCVPNCGRCVSVCGFDLRPELDETGCLKLFLLVA
jgi:hypothetical protein